MSRHEERVIPDPSEIDGSRYPGLLPGDGIVGSHAG